MNKTPDFPSLLKETIALLKEMEDQPESANDKTGQSNFSANWVSAHDRLNNRWFLVNQRKRVRC